MKNRGKFIVFEGGEGSGKSSSINTALACLEENGIQAVKTREPGGTPGADAIRSILITQGSTFDPVANTLLFAAARRDHIKKIIEPALEQGQWVVSDRFVLSTIAYQGAEGVDRDLIMNIHKQTCEGLMPDLTIILDVDPRTGIARSKARLSEQNSNEGRFEDYDLRFHESIRNTNLEYDLSRSVLIDASCNYEDVQISVRQQIQEYLSQTQER